NYQWELFRLSYVRGLITFEDNIISYNDYARFFWWSTNYKDVIIKDNAFIGNIANTRTYAMFRIANTQADVIITGNEFSNNTFRHFMYMTNPSAHFAVSMNSMINNTGSQWGMYMATTQADASFDFDGNYLLNNSFNGWFWSNNQNSMWTIDSNTLEGNNFGNRGFLWIYGNTMAGGFFIARNTFIYNNGGGSYFKFYGLGYWGDLEMTFYKNTFINNTATTASNGGLLYFYKNKMDIVVSDCTFINNSANCIVVYWSYILYNNHFSNSYTFEGNLFANNTGKGIAYSEGSNSYITIRGNTGYGNEDYCVYLDHHMSYQNYYNDPDHFRLQSYGVQRGPNELIIE
ncbi:MAG: hypothetical protein KAQ96_14405, partial [Thermoplasmata archaeon]|nr:hypothetical protein [Thermoplasmata archaeon]